MLGKRALDRDFEYTFSAEKPDQEQNQETDENRKIEVPRLHINILARSYYSSSMPAFPMQITGVYLY